MKVDRQFALEAYSHPSAVKGYSRAVREIGLWKSEKRVFLRHLGTEGRVLDLGCGAGRTTFGLYREGYRKILGADLCPAMIRQARRHALRRKAAIRFRVADACRLPFRSRSFDGCIFSFNGLMTIPRRSRRIAALREIRRVLKPGGRFVFTTHERRSGRWKEGSHDPRLHEDGDELLEELGRPTFVHVPDRREILDCLRMAGLEWVEDRRSDMARESKGVKDFAGSELRFWVARKPDSRRTAGPL